MLWQVLSTTLSTRIGAIFIFNLFQIVAVTASTAILILVFRGTIPVAPAGLALSYAAQLSGVFQFTVRLASETETKFICIERMKSFLRRAVLEEPELFSSNDKSLRKPENLLLIRSLEDLNQNWPFAGRVKFDSVYFSYSGKDVILKNLCFEVQPGQKIGMQRNVNEMLVEIEDLIRVHFHYFRNSWSHW
jgi:ATP-binding cassette subfamily C (CFTR/MRP) protein 5